MSDVLLDILASRFTLLLEQQGLHNALGFLNARTRHRFTGVYRFQPPTLRGLCLYDRENPSIRLAGDTPMRETYCSLVGETAAPFATDEARGDARLAADPAREAVAAYCGVPLRGRGGVCVGTLCHFDPRPRVAPVGELPLLARVAPLVMGAVARSWGEDLEVAPQDEANDLASGRG